MHIFKDSVCIFYQRVSNLNLSSPLRQAVVLGQELLPLMLPQLGRGHVQVDVLSAPHELVASKTKISNKTKY